MLELSAGSKQFPRRIGNTMSLHATKLHSAVRSTIATLLLLAGNGVALGGLIVLVITMVGGNGEFLIEAAIMLIVGATVAVLSSIVLKHESKKFPLG